MPSIAVRIPSVHPHRSPPGLLVSLPIFPGKFYDVTSNAWKVLLRFLSHRLSNTLSLTSHHRVSFESSRHGLWFVCRLYTYLLFLYASFFPESQVSLCHSSSVLLSLLLLFGKFGFFTASLRAHLTSCPGFFFSSLQPKTPWCSFSPAHHYSPC